MVYSILGVARLGATRLGYHSQRLLCQVGPRLSVSRLGFARLGATRLGMTVANPNLRYPLRDRFELEDAGFTQAPTCTLNLVTTPAGRPCAWDVVILAVGTLKNRLFYGFVESQDSAPLTPEREQVSLTAVGTLKRLIRRSVFATYTDEPAGIILQRVLAEYAPYITLLRPLIEDGPTISEITFPGVPALLCCQELARQAGFTFYVDVQQRAHFHALDAADAPWEIDAAERYANLHIKEDSSELVTRIIVQYSRLVTRTQLWRGDGVTKEFRISDPVHQVLSLTAGGVLMTYGTRYKEDNSANDFDVNYDQGYLTARAYGTPAAGVVIHMTYIAKTPVRLSVTDAAAAAAQRSDGTDGLRDLLITDRDMVSRTDALTRALAILEDRAWPRISAGYERYELIAAYQSRRLQVGQVQRLNARGYDRTLLLRRVSTSVLVPDDGAGLVMQMRVEAGSQPPTLEELFQALTPAPPQAATELEEEISV